MYLMKNAVQINIIIILLLQFKETIFYYLGYQSSVSHDSSEIILIYRYIYREITEFV